jgi:hypothetical protein
MKRYDICKSCSHFNSFWKTCNSCKCFMPIKVLIPSAKCPEGQWEIIDGIDQKTNEVTESSKRSYSQKTKRKGHG